MLSTMQVLVEDAMYVSQGKITITNEGMLRISGDIVVWSYLMVRSTSRCIGVPAAKLLCNSINPKGHRYLHLVNYNQQNSSGEFKKPA